MKKLVIFIFILLSSRGYSQITLDYQSSTPLVYFKLNNSETKYYKDDINSINSTNQLMLYNLNGSLYKTIQIPSIPNSYISKIDWITETLFDNNPSNIEFLAFYWSDSASWIQVQARVFREDGTILLDELNARSYFYINLSYNTPLIYLTEEGPKLMLDYQYAKGNYYQTKVFNLPGEIPTGIQLNQQERDTRLSLYPNPNNGSFFVNFHSNSENTHIIDLYSTNGKLIETYQSQSNLMQINNFGLSEGIYLLNSRSKSINSTTKMIIKK